MPLKKGIELRNKLVLLRQISTLFKRLKFFSDIYAETIKKMVSIEVSTYARYGCFGWSPYSLES